MPTIQIAAQSFTTAITGFANTALTPVSGSLMSNVYPTMTGFLSASGQPGLQVMVKSVDSATSVTLVPLPNDTTPIGTQTNLTAYNGGTLSLGYQIVPLDTTAVELARLAQIVANP